MATRSRDGLYLRGGVWWCRVPAYPGGPKVRRSTKCEDRVAARLAKTELERRSASPADYAANKATLADAVRVYIDDCRRKRLAEPTIEIYEDKCRHVMRVLGKDRPLATICASTWDGYIETREREGAHSHSVKKELTRGRGALAAAKRRGWFPADLAAVMPVYSAGYKPRERALTLDEIPKLLAELRPDRLAYVAFAIATGCRRAELYRARREHYSDDGTVAIQGSKTRKSRRRIPVAPIFEPLLALALEHAPGVDLLFPEWINARRDIIAACDRAGIGHVTWNDLRRTNATILHQAGVPNADVATLLGHVDSRMVETVYGQDSPTSLAASLDRAFGTQSAQPPDGASVLPSEMRDSGEWIQASGAVGRRFESCRAREESAENKGSASSAPSAKSTDPVVERYTTDTAIRGAMRKCVRIAETDRTERGRGAVERILAVLTERFAPVGG